MQMIKCVIFPLLGLAISACVNQDGVKEDKLNATLKIDGYYHSEFDQDSTLAKETLRFVDKVNRRVVVSKVLMTQGAGESGLHVTKTKESGNYHIDCRQGRQFCFLTIDGELDGDEFKYTYRLSYSGALVRGDGIRKRFISDTLDNI
ncbi:hypothetical protein [Enterovibrio norvegicus]|uniref:hypothetical protein n=1 Tax=Enterovibrio norvegicus TaxID=188144 RepID=UPI000C85F781|nr:hypothetical protein [Enterovibrio norvegicus]PMN70399.1 hypothetical protein BCT27_18610 [Enterovibrio norvegicus]